MDIRQKVNVIIRKYGSHNPFEIIQCLNVIIIYAPLVDVRGFYQYYKRNNIIYLNENLSYSEKKLVLAHELGHLFLHKKSNFIFMDTHTDFNTNKYEIEANKFAMELLISDYDLIQYQEYTTEQLSRIFGYDEKLIQLRLK